MNSNSRIYLSLTALATAGRCHLHGWHVFGAFLVSFWQRCPKNFVQYLREYDVICQWGLTFERRLLPCKGTILFFLKSHIGKLSTKDNFCGQWCQWHRWAQKRRFHNRIYRQIRVNTQKTLPREWGAKLGIVWWEKKTGVKNRPFNQMLFITQGLYIVGIITSEILQI
jgi:hypothetical protein